MNVHGIHRYAVKTLDMEYNMLFNCANKVVTVLYYLAALRQPSQESQLKCLHRYTGHWHAQVLPVSLGSICNDFILSP
jgi:hypothetical protein